MLALAGTALSFPTVASAAPAPSEILAGSYIKIGLNGFGTLGSEDSTPPGILYDGTGTGTFNPSYDYLTPGTPFEGFTFTGSSSAGAFTASNNNASDYSRDIGGALTLYNGVAHGGTTYDNRAVWTGTYGALFTVTHDYYFNDDGQQLNITTTIEALTDLTGLNFSRFTDPDARAATGDSSSTNNFQGGTGVATNDLVYAEALASKYVIGLYTSDATAHNSAVTNWTYDTASYLAGGSIGNGDNTIGLGFNIGDLTSGSVFSFNYRYIFGTDISAALGAAGAGGGGGPKPTIQDGGAYTVEQLLSGAVDPTFNGGVLTLGSSGAAPTDFTVETAGGTIDTAGHDLTLSGVLSGPGALNKSGAGVLTLTGANTHGGFNVQGGVLAFDSGAALGGGATISNGATLRTLADMTLVQGLQIQIGQQGGFDTAGHDVTLGGDVTGGGVLQKIGAGSLTLSGDNRHSVLDVMGGTVVIGSQQSQGAAGGLIILQGGATLGVGTGMTISQGLDIQGEGARFDTGANNVVMTGVVSGNACLIKAGAGHLSLNAAGSNAIGACVQQGQLSFNNVFSGQVWVDNGGVASGGGLIRGDVAVNGVLAPGNSPGRLVVAGDVTQSATGVLAIDIDGPTAGVGAGHHDTLVLTGAGSTFTAGGTIAPTTRGITGAALNTYTPQIGDVFEVVSAEGGVAGSFAAVTQPTQGVPANSRFDVIYLPKAIALAVTPNSYRQLAISGRTNAEAAAAAADRARGPAGQRASTLPGAFAAGLAGLNQAQILTALQQGAGEIHADSVDAMLQYNRTNRAQVSGRLSNAQLGDGKLWVVVGGDTLKVEADAHASGYRADSGSVTIGLDRALTDTLLVGAAVSYGETELDAGLMGDGKSFSYQGHAYAGWRSGDYYVNGVVSVGSDTYKTARSIDFFTGSDRFAAKTDGASLAADVEAGRHLTWGPAAVTLAAGLSSDRIERDGVQEMGGAIGALAFEDETRTAVQGRIGALVRAETDVWSVKVRPQASLFVMQEFGDKASAFDTALHGERFSVTAASPGDTSVKLATSVETALSERTRVSLGYRYGWSDNAQSHAVRATAAIAW